MVALVPSEADLDRLAFDGGEPRDELHLTLWFLGDAEAIDDDQREALRNAVGGLSEFKDVGPIRARAFGVAHWNPTGDDPAWVLNVGDGMTRDGDGFVNDSLAYVRGVVMSAVSDGVAAFSMPEQHSPWQPHICIAYSSSTDLVDDLTSRLGDVTFDRVRVAFGGDVTDFELTQPATVSAALGGGTVPWHKVHGHAECTDGKPWAVVKDAGGELEGCHASEADADQQLAALYASEQDTTAIIDAVMGGELVPNASSADVLAKKDDGGGCGDGYHRMPDGSCMSDAEMAVASRWTGVLVVEGTPTGDGREFSPGALSWVEGALLRWQKEGSHGGTHDVTVSVGRIDEVWRDGSAVRGRGVLNLMETDGWTVYNRLRNGFAGGISIDADDITDADVEFVWNDGDEGDTVVDEDDIIKFLFDRPEKTIYHAGRVRAATLCDIPAFVEAHISLLGADEVIEPADGLVAAVEVHDVAVVDEPWKMTVAKHMQVAPREAYAWHVNDGDKPVGRLLHHDVVDGEVSSANLNACVQALAQLTTQRGIVPESDEAAVYEHLAAHLRAAGLEPPPPRDGTDASLVAAAVVDLNDWRPPRSWFDNPQLTVQTGITVTDQGRVYGHVAPWGECHIGFVEECVTTPMEDAHPYFMTGELVCADGERVGVGQITLGTGHAPISYQASRAAEHYDNTGCAVADVVVGNDAHGIWCAGAIRPFVEAARVHQLRASGRVSGDWRRIGGQLRLVGVLAVNVPGFPIPQVRARVASGIPQALVAAGTHLAIGRVDEPAATPSDVELDQLAMRRVMDLLARRVHETAEVEGAH